MATPSLGIWGEGSSPCPWPLVYSLYEGVTEAQFHRQNALRPSAGPL
jgi:hypothetical protein